MKVPLAPKYFLQSFNGTPHPLVRLETVASWGTSSSGTVLFACSSECFRVIFSSSCQCYDSNTLLFIHVCNGWNFGLSLHETSLPTLGRQACAVQNTSNCTECTVIAACMLSAHRVQGTGYSVRVLLNSSCVSIQNSKHNTHNYRFYQFLHICSTNAHKHLKATHTGNRATDKQWKSRHHKATTQTRLILAQTLWPLENPHTGSAITTEHKQFDKQVHLYGLPAHVYQHLLYLYDLRAF